MSSRPLIPGVPVPRAPSLGPSVHGLAGRELLDHVPELAALNGGGVEPLALQKSQPSLQELDPELVHVVVVPGHTRAFGGGSIKQMYEHIIEINLFERGQREDTHKFSNLLP